MTEGRDSIELNGIRVLALCGVLPEERARRQPFSIDIEVFCDLANAARSDSLEATIDYGTLGEAIATLAERESFMLLERFAERIAATVLKSPLAEAVSVRVRKLRPPMAQDIASSGVRIHRSN